MGRSRLLLTIGVAVLVWIGNFAVMVGVSSSPYLCGVCHEIQPEVKAWRNSGHAEVNCYACHAPPGVSAFLRAKVKLGSDVLQHITGAYRVPIRSHRMTERRISTAVCLRCHTPTRGVTPSKGIKIDHVIHLKKGLVCVDCHNRTSHPGLAGRTDYLKMPACFRCHGVEPIADAPGQCDKCHAPTFDLKPDNHKTKKWIVNRHSKLAKNNRRPCLMCHRKIFCDNCHQLPMPHPVNWARAQSLHSRAGIKTPGKCVMCHTEANFCNSCHHKGFKPKKGPWVRQHFDVVRAKGLYDCIKCHGLVFCATCHVRGLSKPGQL